MYFAIQIAIYERVRRERDAEWLKNCHRTYIMAKPYTIKENSIQKNHLPKFIECHRIVNNNIKYIWSNYFVKILHY